MDEHPGVHFVDGAMGRRAAVMGTGLDVWEIVEVAKENDGSIEEAAGYLEIDPRIVEIAVRYYGSNQEEIDGWIARPTWSRRGCRGGASRSEGSDGSRPVRFPARRATGHRHAGPRRLPLAARRRRASRRPDWRARLRAAPVLPEPEGHRPDRSRPRRSPRLPSRERCRSAAGRRSVARSPDGGLSAAGDIRQPFRGGWERSCPATRRTTCPAGPRRRSSDSRTRPWRRWHE